MTTPATPSVALAATLGSLLDADFAASPVSGSAVGLTQYDDRLDDLSAEAFAARDAYAADLLARLDAMVRRLTA